MAEVVRLLAGLGLSVLRTFEDYLRERSAPASMTGPDHQALWARAGALAAAGAPAAPGSSTRSIEPLVAEGCGPAQHLAAALDLEHPMCS